jgi:uncharacterized protein YoxC
MTAIAFEVAKVAVGAAFAYFLLHLRVSQVEQNQRAFLDRTEKCLDELNARIETLTKLTARLEGYLAGVKNGRKK